MLARWPTHFESPLSRQDGMVMGRPSFGLTQIYIILVFAQGKHIVAQNTNGFRKYITEQ